MRPRTPKKPIAWRIAMRLRRISVVRLRRTWAWLGILALGLVLLAGGAAGAQVNTVDLSGQVLDPQGLAVPGAKVAVRNLATGATRSAETDQSGRYRIVGLPPGRYELTVDGGKGLAKLVNPELVLTIGQSAEFDAHPPLQSGAEVVKVEESTELIEMGRTAVADTVNQRQINNLPINGRNYINFTLLDSQAQRDSAPSIGAAPTSGINFGGQRARSNQVSVDGADATDNSVNGVRATVSQEAVQEFQIIVSNYMPEFGRATGGVVNIVTKSGANDFHGNVFGFLRHKSIQARNPFSVSVDSAGNAVPVKQPFTRVQAGATLGGPIVKDKTFYFFSYETTRRQETGFTNIGEGRFGFQSPTAIPCVPFPLTLRSSQIGFYTTALGPFAAAGACTTHPTARALTGAALITGASSNVALNADMNKNGDGTTVPLAAALGIPSALGSKFFPPAFPGILAALPTPSFVGLNSLRGNFPLSEGTSLWSARLDHQWNPRNNSFVRVSVSPSTITGIQVNAQNQILGTNAGSRTSLQESRDFAVVGQHVTAFTNTLFNELRFQFARRGLHYGFSQLPGGSNVAVDILGFASFGREPFSSVNRIERRFQWTDNLSWIKGRHTFKFGGDINLIQIRSNTDQIFQLDFGGIYRFSALSAGDTGLPTSLTAVQSYGLGVPGSFLQGMGTSGRPFDNKPLAFFAQDSWRIHPRLTLNFGVRYDIELTPQFTPKTAALAAIEQALGVAEGSKLDKNNVAPRFALAWDPWGTGKTVIRAGYGLFYDHPPLASDFLSATQDGFQSGQYTFGPGAPSAALLSAANARTVLNASTLFQGILNAPASFNLGYQSPSTGSLNQQRFDPLFPNSFFTNYNFLKPGTSLPLAFLPFTFPVAANFVYGYAQQGNLTIERQLARDYKISVGYTYTHALHLNRARNINATNPGLLVSNAATAIRFGYATPGTNPLLIAAPLGTGTPGSCVANPSGGGMARIDFPGVFATIFPGSSCTGTPAGVIGTAAIFNFFRPSGPNPTFVALNPALSRANLQALAGPAGFPVGPSIDMPISDVNQQESSGNSIYHGLTVAVSKRFSHHFEFLSSYTWSHSIDDSTDLQSLLAPQDNRKTFLERGNSTFDQRHRWVTSAVFESSFKRTDDSFWRKFLADFTVAPIIEVSSGRPFNVLSGNDFNLDFTPFTDRPSVVPVGTPGSVTSRFIPGVAFSVPTRCDNPALLPFGCTGNLGRNAFTRPGFFQWDLRVSRKFYFTEKVNLEFIADMFNLFNRNNTADVNSLCDPTASCLAGQPTAALDPRQFQFALKFNW